MSKEPATTVPQSTHGSRNCLPLRTPQEQAARRAQLTDNATSLAVQLAPPAPANPAGSIERDRYEIWVGPCVLEDITDRAVYLSAPTEIRGWLPHRQGREIKRAATKVLGRPVRAVVFVNWPPAHEQTQFHTLLDLERADTGTVAA